MITPEEHEASMPSWGNWEWDVEFQCWIEVKNNGNT